MKRLRFRLEALLFRGLTGAAPLLPRRAMLGLGGVLGRAVFAIDRRHRSRTLAHLRGALGETLGPGDLRRVALACWRQLGRNVMDTIFFPRFGPDSIGRQVHYEGLEHIRAAYARGRGVLLFSAHFGQWELTALMQGFLGLPLTLITRPLDNPRLERQLAGLRCSSGNRVVHKRNAVREMVRSLRAGLGVAIVIDQDALRDGVFVPFFDRLASTTPTLARLALRTGAAVVPTFCVPLADGEYRIVYEAPVEPQRSGNLERDTVALTAQCTAIIERWVRAHPEHWLWMHRRWKTPPPVEPAGRRSRVAAREES